MTKSSGVRAGMILCPLIVKEINFSLVIRLESQWNQWLREWLQGPHTCLTLFPSSNEIFLTSQNIMVLDVAKGKQYFLMITHTLVIVQYLSSQRVCIFNFQKLLSTKNSFFFLYPRNARQSIPDQPILLPCRNSPFTGASPFTETVPDPSYSPFTNCPQYISCLFTSLPIPENYPALHCPTYLKSYGPRSTSNFYLRKSCISSWRTLSAPVPWQWSFCQQPSQKIDSSPLMSFGLVYLPQPHFLPLRNSPSQSGVIPHPS